jgi:hypothetical protein
MLDCVDIAPETFKQFMASFSKLVELEVTARDHSSSEEDYEGYITPSNLRIALECHAASLDVLDIDLENVVYTEDRIVDGRTYPNVGPLHLFEQLRILRIDRARLGHFSYLPLNITRLDLREYPYDDRLKGRDDHSSQTWKIINLKSIVLHTSCVRAKYE